MMRVRALHTVYPHMGAHSGMSQFTRFLAPHGIQVDSIGVADDHEGIPIRDWRKRDKLRALVAKRGVAWYKLSDLYQEWRALRAAVRDGIDLIHFVDGEHGPAFLPPILRRTRFIPSRASRTRMLATFHQPPALFDGLLNPRVIDHLDAVTVVSPTQADWFRARGKRVDVILHGVDTDFFRPVTLDPGFQASALSPFRCVTSGHWLRDWNAIRAVAELLRHDVFEFHVVTSRTTGLEDLPHVVHHRSVPDEELLRVYQGADALLLPLTDSTANNSLMEGIACGLPVVSSAIPSVCAYLPGGEAILIDGNRPNEIADALLWMKRDPEGRIAMGRQARARAEQLSWSNVAGEFAALYRELCA